MINDNIIFIIFTKYTIIVYDNILTYLATNDI